VSKTLRKLNPADKLGKAIETKLATNLDSMVEYTERLQAFSQKVSNQNEKLQ